MVILGIDPGYAIVGCGVVRYEKGNFSLMGYGAITTDKDMPFNQRLKKIYDDIKELLQRFKNGYRRCTGERCYSACG